MRKNCSQIIAIRWHNELSSEWTLDVVVESFRFSGLATLICALCDATSNDFDYSFLRFCISIQPLTGLSLLARYSHALSIAQCNVGNGANELHSWRIKSNGNMWIEMRLAAKNECKSCAVSICTASHIHFWRMYSEAAQGSCRTCFVFRYKVENNMPNAVWRQQMRYLSLRTTDKTFIFEPWSLEGDGDTKNHSDWQ